MKTWFYFLSDLVLNCVLAFLSVMLASFVCILFSNWLGQAEFLSVGSDLDGIFSDVLSAEALSDMNVIVERISRLFLEDHHRISQLFSSNEEVLDVHHSTEDRLQADLVSLATEFLYTLDIEVGKGLFVRYFFLLISHVHVELCRFDVVVFVRVDFPPDRSFFLFSFFFSDFGLFCLCF